MGAGTGCGSSSGVSEVKGLRPEVECSKAIISPEQ